jgi:hypothetical protein
MEYVLQLLFILFVWIVSFSLYIGLIWLLTHRKNILTRKNKNAFIS